MEEKKFIITESQIEEIFHFLDNHSTLAVRNLLKQLPMVEKKQEDKTEEKDKNGKV